MQHALKNVPMDISSIKQVWAARNAIQIVLLAQKIQEIALLVEEIYCHCYVIINVYQIVEMVSLMILVIIYVYLAEVVV